MMFVKPNLIQNSTSIQIDWCLNIYEKTSFHKSWGLTGSALPADTVVATPHKEGLSFQ